MSAKSIWTRDIQATVMKQTCEYLENHSKGLGLSMGEVIDRLVVNIKAPSTEKEVWGGIFVTPVQTSVGQITFLLSGIIQYKGNDIWSVISPFMKEAITPTTEILDDLTPIETIKEDVIKENTDKPVTDSKKKKKKTKKK